MRDISGKSTYAWLLVLVLALGLTAVWAQEGKKPKKAKATVAETKGKSKEPLTGSWKGTYTREGATNTITMDLVQKGTTVTGNLVVDAGMLPVDKGVYDPKEKKFTFETGPSEQERYQITGMLKGDTISGQWKGGNESGPFNVSRAKDAPASQ